MRTMIIHRGRLLLLVLLCAGCLTADGTLEPGGGAQVTIDFPSLGDDAAGKGARALVTAPGVVVESLEMRDVETGFLGSRRAVAKLSTKDVHKLGTLPLLKSVGASITHEAKDGGGVLRVAVKNPAPKPADDGDVAKYEKHEIRVGIALPGPIVETTAKQDGDRVTWAFSAKEWVLGKAFDASVTYGPTVAESTTGEKPTEPETPSDGS